MASSSIKSEARLLVEQLPDDATWEDLMDRVWDRIDEAGHQPVLGDEFKAELDRRIADHKANPGAAIPWEQVYAEALARARK